MGINGGTIGLSTDDVTVFCTLDLGSYRLAVMAQASLLKLLADPLAPAALLESFIENLAGNGRKPDPLRYLSAMDKHIQLAITMERHFDPAQHKQLLDAHLSYLKWENRWRDARHV